MPKNAPSIGDWGDFIYREENSGKKGRDPNHGKKGHGGTGPKKDPAGERKDKKYRKDTTPPGGKDPNADASSGRKEKGSDNNLDDFFNSEFADANYRVDDNDQQFRRANVGTDTKDSGGSSSDADDIRYKAKKDINDIAQEQEPWNIKAEDIAPEHLATLYNTGTVYKILGIFFSKQIYRSRVKQAQKDIDTMHKSRNKEHKLQEKHSARLTKEEHKKQIMKQQVRDSEVRLTLERERILRPVELEYERLREKVSGLNQAQYSIYRDPINKIGNTFQKFWTEKQSLPRIERKVKRRKDKMQPLEIDHQNLTADLNRLAANVKHLHQEIQSSKNRIAAIEDQIYSIARIHPSARKTRAETDKEESQSRQSPRQRAPENYAETKLNLIEEMREVQQRHMAEAELDDAILVLNQKYGNGFQEFGSKFLKKHSYPKPTTNGKYFWIQLYENNGRYKIKKVIQHKKQAHTQEQNAA